MLYYEYPNSTATRNASRAALDAKDFAVDAERAKIDALKLKNNFKVINQAVQKLSRIRDKDANKISEMLGELSASSLSDLKDLRKLKKISLKVNEEASEARTAAQEAHTNATAIEVEVIDTLEELKSRAHKAYIKARSRAEFNLNLL